MFSNLNDQSFHEAALESKFANLENARDSMNALCLRATGSSSTPNSASAMFTFKRSDKSAN